MAERALVVIPTYNERVNLPLIVPQILEQDPRFEVLVVDDNRPTAPANCRRDRRDEPRPRVAPAGKAGLGKAYMQASDGRSTTGTT